MPTHTILSLPVASARDIEIALEKWRESNSGCRELSTDFMEAVGRCFTHSPYLLQSALRYPEILTGLANGKEETLWQSIASNQLRHEYDEPALMQALRVRKSQAALLIGLCDLLGRWSLETVTQRLSILAETSLQDACRFLLQRAFEKGELQDTGNNTQSGLIVLGMGKLGGYELNYSSDIDLIILFDREKVAYTGKQSVQQFFNKLSLDLVRLMQERTGDGYVFRTDLRLRPDPASTPPANSVAAALTYYETVGQNWERAALIKARPVAGDIEAGERFLNDIRSFIWRKNLDFAAIADIQSIRRQMNSQSTRPPLAGYNIKLGYGGIREIEFFTQIHQLIWGGRHAALRLRNTCETLQTLVEEKLLEKEVSSRLCTIYGIYRQIEHRLQMAQDAQTHTLPADEGLLDFSRFCGFADFSAFETMLTANMDYVRKIYGESFRGNQSLSDHGSLIFTGVEADSATLETLRNLGYRKPEAINEAIRHWHHGNRRATRTKRARELITELTPQLLNAFASTAQPDAAFTRFDHFIAKLPAGIQLFSLFQMNPHLLTLIAEIMGNAPALAESLSRNPALLECLLSPIADTDQTGDTLLRESLDEILRLTPHYEDALLALVRFRNEKSFQWGVQFLRKFIDIETLQSLQTTLAECIFQRAVDRIVTEFETSYGRIHGSQFGILGLGRLGAREVAYASDLDIIFLYDAPDMEARSDGAREFNATVYFNRLVQRITSALTMLTTEGILYEIDTRLRPSGKDGPLAVSLAAFDKYLSESAWTFERMALCKARPIYGSDTFGVQMQDMVTKNLTTAQPHHETKQDIVVLRAKIRKEFGANIWDVKHSEGGLMDMDFLAEYLVLTHPEDDLLAPASRHIFRKAFAKELLSKQNCELLLASIHRQNHWLSLLRLCHGSSVDPEEMPEGIRHFVGQHMAAADFQALEIELRAHQKNAAKVLSHYFI